MPPVLASAICAILIAGLFWLDRDREAPTSGALWIPVTWLMLACSRSAAQWLSPGAGSTVTVETTNQVLEGSPLDRNVYVCLIVMSLIVLGFRGGRVRRFLWANGPILFFFFYCAVSFLWSDYPDVAFKRWIKALGDLLMVLIVLSDRDPVAAFKRVLARVGFFLIPLSVLLIKYYPSLGVGYGAWGGGPIYVGVTMNKNSLGVICLCFGLGALWRFMIDYQNKEVPGRTRHLISQGGLLVMVFWLFWISNSMTSMSCFLMASILLIAANSRAVIRRPAMVHLLAASMLAVSSMVVFLDVSPDILAAMGRNPTLTDRTEVWGILRSLAGSPLFGTGFESYWLGPRLEKLWNIYWWHPNEAHNGYLEIFLQLGWVGVGLLAFVIFTGYRNVFRAWRQDVRNGSIFLAFFFVGLVYNFTEAAFFRMLAPAWIFFLFAIVSVPALRNEPFEEAFAQPSTPLAYEKAHSAYRQEVV